MDRTWIGTKDNSEESKINYFYGMLKRASLQEFEIEDLVWEKYLKYS